MKKFLLTFAVLMMAMIGFTACGDDENDPNPGKEETLKSLAKTTWVGKMQEDGMVMDLTITFSDDKNGVEYAKGTMTSAALPMAATVEQYAKFTYTFDGKKGKAVATMITTKSPFGSETYDPREDEDFEPGDNETEFIYDAKTNTLKVVDGDEVEAVLTKTSYKKIDFVSVK